MCILIVFSVVYFLDEGNKFIIIVYAPWNGELVSFVLF